ncbi:hypothetical protein MHYP_G00253430 [Metynnis hypsauchen]
MPASSELPSCALARVVWAVWNAALRFLRVVLCFPVRSSPAGLPVLMCPRCYGRDWMFSEGKQDSDAVLLSEVSGETTWCSVKSSNS